jgi:hypothetical protein
MNDCAGKANSKLPDQTRLMKEKFTETESNMVKDENGYLLADSHILNRWKNYFS